MLAYRILNSYDIKINPLKHGIYSKALIASVLDKYIYDYVNIVCLSNGKNITNSEYKKLLANYRQFYFDYFYDSEFNASSIDEKAEQYKNIIISSFSKLINGHYKKDNKLVSEGLQEILDITSQISNHIYNGSKKTHLTNWISFTKDVNLLTHFYNEQNIHGIAVVKNNIQSLGFANSTICIDLSDKELIEQNPLLVKASDLREHQNMSFVGYTYSERLDVVVYYNDIGVEDIHTILNAIDVDMLYNGMIDEDTIKDKETLRIIHNNVMAYLNVYSLSNDELSKVFFECYLSNRNIKYLQDKYPCIDVLDNKKRLLDKINNINIDGVKKLTSEIRLPEGGEIR